MINRTIKIILLLTISIFFIFSCSKTSNIYQYEVFSKITDAGEVVNKIVINYKKNIINSDIDTNTFNINAKAYIQAGAKKDQLSYDINRNIVKVEILDNKVVLYLDESEGSTLTWLDEGKNYPAKLEYVITQNKNISVIFDNNNKTNIIENAEYNWDNKIINNELSKFIPVTKENGINYQFYESANSDRLIIWLHGDGEGDFNNLTNNNVHIRANRGGVAWVNDDTQAIFGNAHVAAFQAPDRWYYDERDNLAEILYKEINELVEKYKINKENIIIAGCSAGGYMITKMIIKYPNLFASAIINCPDLYCADAIGGRKPTIEELESIKNAKTSIWLVQGITDGEVDTEESSKLIFNVLSKDKNIITTSIKQEFNSHYVTYETEDNKYKLSLYDTVDLEIQKDFLGIKRSYGKLQFAEDYNQDGIYTTVKYSDHWSWIYSLNNNPKSSNGTYIMNWAASFLK